MLLIVTCTLYGALFGFSAMLLLRGLDVNGYIQASTFIAITTTAAVFGHFGLDG